MSRVHKGFTLIEIIIALFIFAILSVIVAVGMNTVLRARSHVKKMDEKMQQMVVAFTLMQRDITQMIDRPVSDNMGTTKPALIDHSDGIEFTRAGYLNPLSAEKRSNMMRVGYQFSGGKLLRITWPSLDLAPNVQPEKQTLLTGIKRVTWKFIDDNGNLVNNWIWSQSGSGRDKNQVMPRAVIVKLTLGEHFSVQRVFAVGGVGLNEPQSQ